MKPPPKEKARYYVKLLGSAVGVSFKEAKDPVKAESGGNMMASCSKTIDLTTNWSAEEPDGLIYAELPRRGDAQVLSKDEKNLLLDGIIIWGHMHPSPAIGDYIPDGLANRVRVLNLTV